MSNDLWLQRWENGETGFHFDRANPLLEKHYDLLELKENSTIFIPLCGKSLDILYFVEKGHNVVGCELSPLAVSEFFAELEVEPEIKEYDTFKSYSIKGITIFEGDIFDLKKEHLGKIDAIYDRAALVALHADVRANYTKHLQELTDSAKQLVLTCCYEQELHQRTPYSVPKEEIEKHYQKSYVIKNIESREIKGGLKGLCPAQDEVWLLNSL